MRQDTKIALAWELLEAGVPKGHMAKRLEISRRTVIRWAQGFQIAGSLTAFLDHYRQAKRGSRRKRDAQLEWRIWKLRSRNRRCCGQKIQYFLEREYHQHVSVTTIYQVLRGRVRLHSKGRRWKPKEPVPRAHRPRQVVQVDTVDFGEVFAYVAVDIYSKEGAVLLEPS